MGIVNNGVVSGYHQITATYSIKKTINSGSPDFAGTASLSATYNMANRTVTINSSLFGNKTTETFTFSQRGVRIILKTSAEAEDTGGIHGDLWVRAEVFFKIQNNAKRLLYGPNKAYSANTGQERAGYYLEDHKGGGTGGATVYAGVSYTAEIWPIDVLLPIGLNNPKLVADATYF
jgi:hypothetical protein